MSRIEFLKKEYGFDKPPVEAACPLGRGPAQGDMGYSFEYQRPVREIVGDRLILTMMVSFATIIFTWIVAFPIGIYSATHQYSWGDYGLTFLGLVGLAIPHFLLALVFMYFANIWFGTSIGGLVDPAYLNQPMSWAKLKSVLERLWIPVIIIGAGGRRRHDPGAAREPARRIAEAVLRHRPRQGPAARQGAAEIPATPLAQLLHIGYRRHPALDRLGRRGGHIVLSLQTTGPLLIRALQSQDMYLAGSFLMFLSFLTVIGVLISDIALAILDPRIRLQGAATK